MRFLISVLFFLFVQSIFSQGFVTRYRLPNALNNASRSIYEVSPGSYLAAGIVVDSVNGIYSNRLCMMGLNAQGQVMWSKKYGSSKFEYLDNLTCSRAFYRNGNFFYYVTCVKDSNNSEIGALLKFNSNGDTIWQKIYRDTEDVITQMVTRSVDGGFFITGYFQNLTNGANPTLLIKTDQNGNELWRKRINKVQPNASDGKAIIQDSASKKIVIVGYQYIGNSSSWSTYDNILILDSLGVKLSQHNYAGLNAFLSDLIQTKDKKFVAVGTTIPAQNYYQSYIVKFDVNAPNFPIWSHISFDPFNLANSFYCIKELDNEDLLIGGSVDTIPVNSSTMPNWMTRLVRMDKNGGLKWKRYYNYSPDTAKPNIQLMVSMDLTSDKGAISSIYSYNPPSPNPFIFVKWDSTGCDTSLAYCRMVAAGVSKNYLQKANINLYPNPGRDVVHISIPSANSFSQLVASFEDVSSREIKAISLTSEKTDQLLDVKDLKPGLYMLNITQNKQAVYTTKFVKVE